MKSFHFKVREDLYDVIEVEENKDTIYHAETVDNTCFIAWDNNGKQEETDMTKREVIRALKDGSWIIQQTK